MWKLAVALVLLAIMLVVLMGSLSLATLIAGPQ